jgi:hypothetical protein
MANTKLKITARAVLNDNAAKELPMNYLKDLAKEINATMDAHLAIDPPADRTGVDFAVTISEDNSFLPMSNEELLICFQDSFRAMEYSQRVKQLSHSEPFFPPSIRVDPDNDVRRFQLYRDELLARLNDKPVVFAAPPDLMNIGGL